MRFRTGKRNLSMTDQMSGQQWDVLGGCSAHTYLVGVLKCLYCSLLSSVPQLKQMIIQNSYCQRVFCNKNSLQESNLVSRFLGTRHIFPNTPPAMYVIIKK